MNQMRRVAAAAVLLILGLTALGASRAGAAPIVANQNYVKQVFLDLLGRPPSPGELAFATQLDNATLTRSQFVTALTSGAEYLTDRAVDFYQLLLHRAPMPSEASSFANLLQSQTFEHVQAIIAGSGEYFTSRSGSTNDGFLDAIFADELKRPVDPSSRIAYDSLLTGGSTRTQVTDLILSSTEYRSDLVNAYYNEFLRRAPSGPEVSGGINVLSSVPDQSYINVLLTSNEYFNLAQTIPEPSSAAACMIGGSILMIRRRR